MTEKSIEQVALNLIAFSGEARSLAFSALRAAEQKKYEKAEELMKKSSENSVLAHKSQTDLLVSEAKGKQTKISVLLIHAQNHLMTSILAQELISEIIKLYKER